MTFYEVVLPTGAVSCPLCGAIALPAYRSPVMPPRGYWLGLCSTCGAIYYHGPGDTIRPLTTAEKVAMRSDKCAPLLKEQQAAIVERLFG